MKNTYVISLGGSIIVPGKIDTEFIKKFVVLILRQIQSRKRFFIVTGGGATARTYIRALRTMGKHISNDDLDWLGISATKLNAQMLISLFGKWARQKLIVDPTPREKDLKAVNLVSGWRPGHSTDLVAVKIAETYGIDTVINLSNIDYVYDRDPRKHKSAKKIEQMTWAEFSRQFGSSWDPGVNLPFDPIGAKLASQYNIKVVIMNGKKLDNLKNFLNNRPFKATVIK